jgi:hypothetical protein
MKLFAVVFAALVAGSLFESYAVYLIVLAAGAVWAYGLDWSELKADRRTVDEPVVRERRRRDFEVGR